MRRRFWQILLVWSVLCVVPAVASACPMCKDANEADDPRPRAYMYSILFMLAVPATMLAGFGITFYRLSRQQPPAGPDDESRQAPPASR